MITVAGEKGDYAILKQVQQLKLMAKDMSIMSLDAQVDFSGLDKSERLYVVAHGGAGTLRNIRNEDLISWLTDPKRGVPSGYAGGIILLSCYSGQKPTIGLSLAGSVAASLSGRAAQHMPVEGATGYSYGTPEFQSSGRSSVVAHETFYTATNIVRMTEEWLKLKPTHLRGVLYDLLGAVDTGTVGDQLERAAAEKKLSKTPVEIAQDHVTKFGQEVDRIQRELHRILWDKIPGPTVADRAAYLLQNQEDPEVVNWNKAIGQQYALFSGLYLWKPQTDAFTVEQVP